MRYLLVALFAIAGVNVGSAAIVYEVHFRVEGIDYFSGSDVLVQSPDAVINSVEILLRETATAGEQTVLGSATGGLRGFALDVRSSDGPSQFRNLVRNNAFQFAGSGNGDGDTISAFNFAGGTIGSRLDANTVILRLGTLDLVAPSAERQTTFSLVDADPANPNFNLQGGAAIDSSIGFRSLTISTVTAIPEPSSILALMAMTGTVLMARRRRPV